MLTASARQGMVALALLAWGAPALAQTCAQPRGILDALLVADARVATLDSGSFLVERGGQPVNLNIGDPLCEADRMATRPDTTAKLLVGPAEGPRHELTVLPGATVVLQSVSRIELVIGRLLAAVQGNFDVVMPFARLAATGTEFAVEVTQEGCRVEQLEGSTGLTPSAGATARLERLKSASCTATAAAPSELVPGRCTELMTAASRIDVAARPLVRSGNAIRQLDPAQAPGAYAQAREAAICRNDAAAWQAVDKVLVDWERPQKALDAEDPLVRGRALLMRGQPERAIEEFRRALAAGPGAAALAGFGDAERDLGLKAIRANDLAEAGRRFESALRHYTAAFERATSERERGVILVNLGDLALLRTRLDPAAAEARLSEAQATFERARTHADPPHARLGLARVSLLRASLIPTQQIDASEGSFGQVLTANILLSQMAESQRKPHRAQARTVLRELIADTPGFAPAEELLADLLAATGERDRARVQYQRAIAADPGNTSAYLGYSKTLGSRRQRMYEAAYRLVEVAAVRERDEARAEILQPRESTVTVPPAPLTPDVMRLAFEKRGQQQAVTLTNRSNAVATAGAATIAGRDPAAFRILRDGCANVQVDAGRDCRILIEYIPQGSGSHRATLEIPFDGGLGREVKLSGETPAHIIG